MADNTMLQRIRAEYLEMPGLSLTLEQAQRLCGVEQALCTTVLNALVDEKFLCVKAGGNYARLTDGEEIPRPPAMKTDLRRAVRRTGRERRTQDVCAG